MHNKLIIKVGWGASSKKWCVHVTLQDDIGRSIFSRYSYADSTAPMDEEAAALLMQRVRQEIEAFLPL